MNLHTKRTFLNINRITQTIFLGTQVIQLLRSQLSFYDLLILSLIHSLLALPFLVHEVPTHFFDVVLSAIRILVLVYLLAVTLQE
jgi:hypothetical protein